MKDKSFIAIRDGEFEIVLQISIKPNCGFNSLMDKFMVMKEEFFQKEDCFSNFFKNCKTNPNNNSNLLINHGNIEKEDLFSEVQQKKSKRETSIPIDQNFETVSDHINNNEDYKKKLRNRIGKSTDLFQNFERRRNKRAMQNKRLQKVIITETEDEQLCSICLGKYLGLFPR